MSGVYLAYDASIHGDWVSHYAVRLAARHARRTLGVVTVDDGDLPPDRDVKFSRLESECRRQGVACETRVAPLAESVWETIRTVVPAGPDSFLVCGTRTRAQRRGWLRGTVSERLLRSRHCQVLAIRVAQPGLLGLPRQFLAPVSGHPRGFQAGLPFLKLFAPDVVRLHVLFVQRVGTWRYRLASPATVEQLAGRGRRYCERIEDEIRRQIGDAAPLTDAQVIISDDVPREIVVAADRTKSRLVYLGASERTWPQRTWYGNPVEQVLRDVHCDVAIYRGLA